MGARQHAENVDMKLFAGPITVLTLAIALLAATPAVAGAAVGSVCCMDRAIRRTVDHRRDRRTGRSPADAGSGVVLPRRPQLPGRRWCRHDLGRRQRPRRRHEPVGSTGTSPGRPGLWPDSRRLLPGNDARAGPLERAALGEPRRRTREGAAQGSGEHLRAERPSR